MKHIFFRLVLLTTLAASGTSLAVEGVYLGGQAGFTGLTGNPSLVYGNAIGFGVDLGLRTSYLIDVLGHFQTSSHANLAGLTLYSGTVSADAHILQADIFDVSIGAGPGFYFFNTPTASETDFGINFGGAVDAVIDESLVIGIGARYHAVFSSAMGGSFYNVMMRLGYIFKF